MKNALEIARAYKPSIKKEMKVEAALQSPRYFGVKLDVDLKKLVGELLGAFGQTPQEPTQKAGHQMFTELVKNRRITATPHLTLVHQNQTEESEEMKRLWDEYQGRVLARKVAFGLLLGPKLIWNNRVMILEARVRTQDSATDPAPTSIRYHVTIGTADESIRPVEGFDLLHHFFRSVPPASHSSTQPAPSSQTHATLDAGKEDADRAGEVLFLDVKTVSVSGTL
ncbi:hypothetical protein PGT21_019376 [Puccinia graminis f. sp. tritici]|uniref:tRNA ligase phosphodiesterase domain-containing protein n=1 Tax=Puccinia graminis f. sp. tritici TaxID=56615 RepID=A0A5B0LKY3_PUCGR|nr:hypothetical protein PGT21_019376 [Puccinia graminis f. sp. tritici]